MIQTLKTVKEYKESLIAPAIREMLEALDIARDLRPGMKVVIKPNLVMAKKPDAPVTTHPLVVKAVAEWLRGAGDRGYHAGGELRRPLHARSI